MSIAEVRRPQTLDDLKGAQRAKNEAWGFLSNERLGLSSDDPIPGPEFFVTKGEDGNYPPGSIMPIYENYPEGFLTAFVDGEAAGNFTLLRMNYDINNPSHDTWDQLTAAGTGSNVVLDGDTLYGSSLGVSPRFRGRNIGARLVWHALKRTVELNCRRFVLGCRIPDYHLHADIPVEQYIRIKRADGEYLDKELRFYSRCGLRFTKPLPNYMSGDWADPESLDYGVLSVWDNPFYEK